MKHAVASVLGFATLAFTALVPGTAAAEGTAYFISPRPGEVVSSPVRVVFGLRGMGVAPAGVQKENTGHHHLLIDTGVPAPGKPIASDDNHRHFGGGQTETLIELSPGEHTLQLLLGDFAHVPHDPPVVSKQISITVK